jgi:rsbT co-antagonist protein RsbR
MIMKTRIAEILGRNENDLVADWVREQMAGMNLPRNMVNEGELQRESRQFLTLFRAALEEPNGGGTFDLAAPQGAALRDLLQNISRSRARQGCTTTETATFIFALKQPLFARLRRDLAGDPEALVSETWTATLLLDKLGLYTAEVYQKGREEVISRQQREMMELSTPVVELWEGVLALPLIGTLDSARTQVVMETLLERIVETGATIAVIDITGVPTVDTLVAQHLLKTVAAARLMGADCIISGIRPQIAQTIVHLGVEMEDVTTKATLAGAFAVALERNGMTISRARPRG